MDGVTVEQMEAAGACWCLALAHSPSPALLPFNHSKPIGIDGAVRNMALLSGQTSEISTLLPTL